MSFQIFLKKSGSPCYYKRRSGYFLAFFDFIPKMIAENGQEIISSELKSVFLDSAIKRNLSCAAFNSSLFWWVFTISSDFRHLNFREVNEFNFQLDALSEGIEGMLEKLNKELMLSLVENSKNLLNNYPKYGRTTIQTFYHNKSKPIIDQIDTVLAQHYGFTEEELDFIINYDIKYRMGKELNNGEDAE